MFTIFLGLKSGKIFSAVFYRWVFDCEPLKCFVIKSPEQVEDQSCKNFDFEDITSQSEKEDNFSQMNVSECLR